MTVVAVLCVTCGSLVKLAVPKVYVSRVKVPNVELPYPTSRAWTRERAWGCTSCVAIALPDDGGGGGVAGGGEDLEAEGGSRVLSGDGERVRGQVCDGSDGASEGGDVGDGSDARLPRGALAFAGWDAQGRELPYRRLQVLGDMVRPRALRPGQG